ncbi:MAG: Ig-like domain-containing protein [Candidatus Bathyarchaeota archaeon]|nr:Ig-like domain-containing protein [Candidatus Bathyarchaeota archaeon]
MKKQLRLYFILLTLIFSIFSFANIILFPSVRATYVEGYITLDTTWTLVDSPFIISNETVVCSNATLTIEPGVEVRFGGFFNITVEGRLIAEGTKSKAIRFTSNEIQPKTGKWGTLWFNSVEESSLFNCIVEYGLNGIIIENGHVNIQKSIIRYNSENGVTILGGYVNIENCEVLNNTLGGIFVSGGSQVSVYNNLISGNGDSIILDGVLTSVNITRNEISFNQHSGILCEAETYGNTIIVNNTIFQNSYGFCVSSDAVTNITRNYILNNDVGIMYESGTGHIAHFNDIIGNELGMDVSSGASVDATYNYWGSESGPYHSTLNPHGKGNPVGGDGVNLDFIFFLTHPMDYNNAPPTALLWTDKVLVAPNQPITFVGADSYDDGRVDYYLFDFGDENSSGWTTLSLFTHSYPEGIYNASLKVRDDFNTTSEVAFAEINVIDLPSLDVSIMLSNYTIEYNEEVLITVYVSYEGSAVEYANVTLFSVKGGIFTPYSGLTNSSGYFTAIFKAPNATEVTDVRIIARASKSLYTDGSVYDYLRVLPPLTVQVNAEPPIVKSEEMTTVTVQVLDSFEMPVTNVSLVLSSENGDLSATTGITDSNGIAMFNFTAFQTLTEINATVSVIATKTGYGKGQSLCIIPIEPKVLFVEVIAEPATIISEESSLITTHVTCDSISISDVAVTISSDVGGNFSSTSETTDSNGNAAFLFTAPQTTVRDGLNATITVSAAKSGYVNGEGYALITILPKILSVQIFAEPNATVSEGKVNVTVHVTCEGSPITEANITLTSESGGIFVPTFALSDDDGNATFTFTAPPVDVACNLTLLAKATKEGYVDGEDWLNITVNPGIIDVEITVKSTIAPEESTTISVHVTCNQAPVFNASVSISCTDGAIPIMTNWTDVDGYCTFVYIAPQTTTSISVNIIANATKYGYASEEKQISIIVSPEAKPSEGLPWTTILLIILIPVIIAVVIVVLVKSKIIEVSAGEEES